MKTRTELLQALVSYLSTARTDMGAHDSEYLRGHDDAEIECAAKILAILAIPDTHVIVPSWMPMDSAPKTGGPIILGYAGSHSAEGSWMGEAARNHWGECGWFDSDADILCDHAYKPDAWMPLPAPPIAAHEKEAGE